LFELYSKLLMFYWVAQTVAAPPTSLRAGGGFRRHMWSGKPLSGLAARTGAVQQQCDRVAYIELPNYGLGSDLQIWADRLCLAAAHNMSLIAVPSGTLSCTPTCANYSFSSARKHCPQGKCDAVGRCESPCQVGASGIAPPWIWHDQQLCPAATPALACSFGGHLNACSRRKVQGMPALLVEDLPASPLSAPNCLTAAVEFLFSRLPPSLLRRAERALFELFGDDGPPEHLITVHIRWGDKWTQMALRPVRDYVREVRSLAEAHHVTNVTAFVTTEDLAALEAFRDLARIQHPSWRVLAYMPAVMQDSRRSSRVVAATGQRLPDSPPKLARASQGSASTESLIALLIALEARLLVVSEFSMWGKLILLLLKARSGDYDHPVACLHGNMASRVGAEHGRGNCGASRLDVRSIGEMASRPENHTGRLENHMAVDRCGAVECGARTLGIGRRRSLTP